MNNYIIGVDVGYGNTKTKNFIFSSGVTKLSGQPGMNDNVVFYNNNYYSVDCTKTGIQQSKIENENTLILTLAAIAMELKKRNETSAAVHLGVGVPLTRVGAEKSDLEDYYKKQHRYTFEFEGIKYDIHLLSVTVLPQGYSAIAGCVSEFKRSTLIIDMGSWTVDILPLKEGKPEIAKCKSLQLGSIKAMQDINEALRQEIGSEADELTLKDIMINGKSDIPDNYLRVSQKILSRYVNDIMEQLRAQGFNPDLMQFVFIGGGATIIDNFIDKKLYPSITVVSDVHINANGYEALIHAKQRKGQLC